MQDWMPLAEYAALHEVTVSAVTRRILKGHFGKEDVEKIAGRWFVRRETPYPYDNRVTVGDYANWRKKGVK